MSAGEKLRSAGGAAQQRLIERSPQEVRGEYLVKLKYSKFFQINLMLLFFFLTCLMCSNFRKLYSTDSWFYQVDTFLSFSHCNCK